MVAAYHSDKECLAENPDLWFKTEEFKERRDLEEIVIYRFLLLVLLYWTDADNSAALESVYWDRAIPLFWKIEAGMNSSCKPIKPS